MARIKGPDASMFRRMPALRARMLMRDTGRGTLYVTLWPRKRARPLHPTTQEQVKKFTAAQAMAKRVFPEMMIAAISLTKRTSLMPRDVLTKALYGQLITLHQIDGRTYVPTGTVNQISALLDLITNVPGQGLVRGAERWEGGSAAGGGGEWAWSRLDADISVNVDFTAAATMGMCFRCRQSGSFDKLRFYIGAPQNWTFVARLAEIDENFQIVSLVNADPLVIPEQESHVYEVDLAGELFAGIRYAILISRTDANDNSECRLNRADRSAWTVPFTNLRFTRLAKKVPAIGDTLTQASTTQYPMFGLRWSPE